MEALATGCRVAPIEASAEPAKGPDGKPAEGTTVMYHPTVLQDMAKRHQDELLAEAEAERLAKAAKPDRMTNGLVDRLRSLVTRIRKPVVEAETPRTA